MNWFKRLFRKKQASSIPSLPPMPSWDTIVERMYDKQLDTFCDEVINVLYSKDRSMRYVVLKDENGIFTYCLEEIVPFDDEEWPHICSDEEALPAMWGSYSGGGVRSFFENETDLLKELQSEPEYKQYFI